MLVFPSVVPALNLGTKPAVPEPPIVPLPPPLGVCQETPEPLDVNTCPLLP